MGMAWKQSRPRRLQPENARYRQEKPVDGPSVAPLGCLEVTKVTTGSGTLEAQDGLVFTVRF